ncbi:hypothetical protein ACA097_07695 [Pseudomonas sp. QL9]|uniref:hypothetical protein n=1 Tax=Pseudomonas sp. QL9 TaxID=3242725 RepID=UPI00352B766A
MSDVSAQEVGPKFQDYKVDCVFAGPNHGLDVSAQSDDIWGEYRRSAIKRKVNFAGHYIIFTGGCGGGAICGEILDAMTGRVVAGFPNAYELDSADGGYYDAEYHPDSRLLEISGKAANSERDRFGKVLLAKNRIRYFEFLGERLVLVSTKGN